MDTDEIKRSAATSASQRLPGPIHMPLIGRSRDTDALVALLVNGRHPVVTLTGPGGVGKTTLAVEVAEQARSVLGNRLMLAHLASLREPDHLLFELSHQLGLTEHHDASVFDLLAGFLAATDTLLLLDNMEQLVDASPDIARLSAAVPGLRLLITSREALNIRHERVYPVGTLPVDERDGGGQAPAVELFLSYAARAGAHYAPGEQDVREIETICRKLDGLPLAIELAASWTRVMSPAAIGALLDRQVGSLRSPMRDIPDRHRTLQAAISWSYDLLDAEEQRFFRAVSTFNGPFSSDAAAAVFGVPAGSIDVLHQIATLISKNMLRSVPHADDTEERYELLETIRAFGREEAVRLGESKTFGERHARYELDFLERSVERLLSPERIAALEHLDREYPNIRSALSWFIEEGDARHAHQVLAIIWRYWEPRGLLHEGMSWADAVLSMPQQVDPETRGWALYGAVVMPLRTGEYDLMLRLVNECMEAFESSGNQRGYAFALNARGVYEHDQGAYDRAAAIHSQALDIRKALDEPQHLIETSTVNLAFSLLKAGRLDEAQALYQEALELESAKGIVHGLAYALNGLGLIAEERNDLDGARDYHERAIEHRKGDDGGALAVSLINLARVLGKQDNDRASLQRYCAALDLCKSRGETPGVLEVLEGIAELLARRGDSQNAGRLVATVRTEGERFSFPRGSIPGLDENLPPMTIDEAVGLVRELELAPSIVTESPVQNHGLTAREREILHLICAGKTDQEIADELFIARSTASRHVANIFQKAGVNSRTAAAAWALQHGLG
ncbi:MAG: tetratricopeptide repeat protein [Thermomicrobiales bacterium]|nr:tetratricopeptide repeat protein [Thermomicrobiales bacterium]